MVAHMKTTVEISDAVFDAARDLAAKEGTTLRALIEAGLRREVEERQRSVAFSLRDGSFGGDGLQDPRLEADWALVRSLIYEGQGG
jgi:hypothetical protein